LRSPPSDSFLPDLRSSKDEGQSNFVNPGIYLYNAGADAKLLPTLKLSECKLPAVRRTQPLNSLLQQNGDPTHHRHWMRASVGLPAIAVG
jgi:hypothetical protein